MSLLINMQVKRAAVLLAAGCIILGAAAGVEAKILSTEVGAEVSYFRYEEPGVMEEEGFMYGVYTSINFHSDTPLEGVTISDVLEDLANSLMFGLDFSLKFGEVDYTSSATGSLDDIDDFMFNIRPRIGIDIQATPNTLVTPYLGFGYRYLNDDSAGMVTTTGHAGYERESNYFYIPFGVETNTRLNDRWNVGVLLEYDLFIDGTQKSHLEDVNPALGTLKNDQSDGYGLYGSIKFVRERSGFTLIIEPFIRYWNIEESDLSIIACSGFSCIAGYEPDNESIDTGLRVGTRF